MASASRRAPPGQRQGSVGPCGSIHPVGDGESDYLVHRAVLALGLNSQEFGLFVGQSQCHCHIEMIPTRYREAPGGAYAGSRANGYLAAALEAGGHPASASALAVSLNRRVTSGAIAGCLAEFDGHVAVDSSALSDTCVVDWQEGSPVGGAVMGRSQVSFASRRFPRLLVALIIGVFVAAGQSALPASATPPPVDRGQWQAAGALLGPAPADAVVTAYLSLVVPAGLPEFALAVTDPSSPTYGKYKTLAQATEAFGASPETLTAVSAAVTKVGGRVDLGPVNTYAKATFTVAQADAFFLRPMGSTPAPVTTSSLLPRKCSRACRRRCPGWWMRSGARDRVRSVQGRRRPTTQRRLRLLRPVRGFPRRPRRRRVLAPRPAAVRELPLAV